MKMRLVAQQNQTWEAVGGQGHTHTVTFHWLTTLCLQVLLPFLSVTLALAEPYFCVPLGGCPDTCLR